MHPNRTGTRERTLVVTFVRFTSPRCWLGVVCACALAVTFNPGAGAQNATPGAAGGSEKTAQLPPAVLPTMNEQGFVFELESGFTGSLDQVPSEAPVYEMTPATFDAASAQAIASRLSIEGEVADQGGGTFAAQGNGSLFVTQGLVQYISAAEAPEGDLPTDDQAVAFAREWLRQTELLPPNIGEGSVVARVENPPRVIITFKPIQPEPLLSADPSITITMGPNASIIEASFRWAELSAGDTYQLRGAEAAWTEVAERRSYVQATIPPETIPPGSTIRGTASYSQVSLAYTSSGIPGEQQYLQPVIVFTGTLTPEGSTVTYPITAYVPGLINSQQPVG